MDEVPRSWFDDTDEVEFDDTPRRTVRRGDRRRRVRLLLVAAGVPWLLVGALVLRGGVPAQPADVPPDAGGPSVAEGHPVEEGADPPGAPDDADVDASGGRTPTDAEDAPTGDGAASWSTLDGRNGAGQSGVEVGDVGATAIVVARAWLTGMDPVLPVEGIEAQPGSYAEHLAVESVERLDADAALVTVSAVVLQTDGDGLVARARRLAVPLTTGLGGPRPAGTPWWLPEPHLDAVPLERFEVDDQSLRVAAADAVAAAGYEEVALTALHRTDAWPWVAEVRARTPAGAPLDGVVWLREHLGGFVVAGTPMHAAAPATSDEEVLP